MVEGPRKFGIDVGGVITDRANDRTDTSFLSDNFLETSPVDGAFDAVSAIVARLGRENVFIVSKCGPRIEDKTRRWLAHRQFFAVTRMDEQALRFCRTREEKAPICARLGITDFVDDRLDVLRFMDGIVTCGFLFRPKPWAPVTAGITSVASWADLLEKAAIGT